MAAIVVTLYLAAVAVAAVLAAVSGDLSALSVAAMAMVWHGFAQGAWLGPLLAGICGLNAWMLWQVLRGPVLPCAEALPPSVVWLRRLLHVNVAGDLMLWEFLDDVSGIGDDVASTLAWAPTMILLVRVVSGVSARFRALALALGLIGVFAPLPLFLLHGPDLRVIGLLGLASFGSTVMILIAQRRDGRWSDATINIGRVALIAPLVFPVLSLAFRDWLFFAGVGLVVNALGVFGTVWLARTAHELATPVRMPAAETATRPGGGSGPWVSAAVVIVPLLVVVGAEEGARFSFTGADEACRRQIRSYAVTPPAARREAFLCLARSDTFAGMPMFPEDLPDQRILAHGNDLCAMTRPSGAAGPAAAGRRVGRPGRTRRRPGVPLPWRHRPAAGR